MFHVGRRQRLQRAVRRYQTDLHRSAVWDSLDLKEQFGALNAIRMPAPCAHDAEGSVDLVNTFARVLNCISDGDLPDQVARQFVISHADMTSFHEYTGKF
jgi:hypothetical protein